MLKVNEYFGGSVKSIAVENEEGTATIGVLEPGGKICPGNMELHLC